MGCKWEFASLTDKVTSKEVDDKLCSSGKENKIMYEAVHESDASRIVYNYKRLGR